MVSLFGSVVSMTVGSTKKPVESSHLPPESDLAGAVLLGAVDEALDGVEGGLVDDRVDEVAEVLGEPIRRS